LLMLLWIKEKPLALTNEMSGADGPSRNKCESGGDEQRPVRQEDAHLCPDRDPGATKPGVKLLGDA